MKKQKPLAGWGSRPTSDPFMATLAKLIEHEKATTTWAELGRRTYVSASTFSAYANGNVRYPRIDTLRGVLGALGFQVDIQPLGSKTRQTNSSTKRKILAGADHASP